MRSLVSDAGRSTRSSLVAFRPVLLCALSTAVLVLSGEPLRPTHPSRGSPCRPQDCTRTLPQPHRPSQLCAPSLSLPLLQFSALHPKPAICLRSVLR